MIWHHFLWVGLGGFLGSIGRFAVGYWVAQWARNHWFPFPTLTVNVIGSFFIGICFGLFHERAIGNEEIRLFFVVGLLGGFTTFSAFSIETLNLIREVKLGEAFLNTFLQVGVCLLASWAGILLSRG